MLDKPPGITSFKALKTVKTRLGSTRVGHTGTLDAFASGLLVALTGSLTKMAPLFVNLDKTYQAVVTFGSGTATLDPEGEVTERGAVPALESILQVLPNFLGEIEQTPPLYSAVHVDGQRAHRLVRAGLTPELKPRRISIYALEFVSYKPPELSLEVCCSKGTYIRSLARDLAAALGTCAFVSRLRRTQVGGFSVAAAVAPQDFQPETHLQQPAGFLKKIPGVETLQLRQDAGPRIRNGIALQEGFFLQPPPGDGTYALLSPEGELVALARRENSRYRYQAVFSGS